MRAGGVNSTINFEGEKEESSILNFMCCTFSLHAHGQTFLIAAVLTAVALAFVDHTVLVVSTSVGQVLTHSPLEETLASLAAVHTVVFTCEKKKKKKSL